MNNSTITGGSGGIASANNGIFSLQGGVGVYQTNGTLIIIVELTLVVQLVHFGSGSQTTIALNNLGAPGVLISENTITGGTIMVHKIMTLQSY